VILAERLGIFFVVFCMQTDKDIRDERQLIGKWAGVERRQTLEYTFQPQHRFTVKIIEADKPDSCAWGYWDVRDGKLRMGTAEDQCDGLPIAVDEVRFTLGDPSMGTSVYTRQSDAV
jgi:hypothetical protein